MKVKNFYRVVGLSAPLLAAGIILAFAQPPSTTVSTPNSPVKSSQVTNIQRAATTSASIQKSTVVALKAIKVSPSEKVKRTTSRAFVAASNTHFSSSLIVKKPSISGSPSGDDTQGAVVSHSKISSTLSPTPAPVSGVGRPSISGGVGDDGSNTDE